MNGRERLIELKRAMEKDFAITCPRRNVEGATLETCHGCQYSIDGVSCDYIGREVDYLLANNVIALPNLKHKQVLYMIYNKTIKPLEVSSYMIRPEFNNLLQIHLHKNGFNGCCTLEDIGKSVFPTKEAAEEALRGECEGK